MTEQMSIVINAESVFDQPGHRLGQLNTMQRLSIWVREGCGRGFAINDYRNVDAMVTGNTPGKPGWERRLNSNFRFLNVFGRDMERDGSAALITLKMPPDIQQREHSAPQGLVDLSHPLILDRVTKESSVA
jgi:hypothetical protein